MKELKILPDYFWEVINNRKTFEIRKNDKNFKINELIKLREYENENDKYTGGYAIVKILYILDGGSYGLDKEHCVFSFDLREQGRTNYRKGELVEIQKGNYKGFILEILKADNEMLWLGNDELGVLVVIQEENVKLYKC